MKDFCQEYGYDLIDGNLVYRNGQMEFSFHVRFTTSVGMKTQAHVPHTITRTHHQNTPLAYGAVWVVIHSDL